SAEDLVNWVIERSTGVFIKPLDSSEGRGVMSLEARNGELLVDKRTSDETSAVRLVSNQDGSLVSELITQGPFGRSVFADAVNTMRVVTMIDPLDSRPFVATAIHRFGTKASAPTDNVSRRGIRSTIDIQTGVLSAGQASWAYENGIFASFSQH